MRACDQDWLPDNADDFINQSTASFLDRWATMYGPAIYHSVQLAQSQAVAHTRTILSYFAPASLRRTRPQALLNTIFDDTRQTKRKRYVHLPVQCLTHFLNPPSISP